MKLMLELLSFWWRPTSLKAELLSIEAVGHLDDKALQEQIQFLQSVQAGRRLKPFIDKFNAPITRTAGAGRAG